MPKIQNKNILKIPMAIYKLSLLKFHNMSYMCVAVVTGGRELERQVSNFTTNLLWCLSLQLSYSICHDNLLTVFVITIFLQSLSLQSSYSLCHFNFLQSVITI